jgi:general stress protein 26
MDPGSESYEQVSVYPLDDAEREQLLQAQVECSFVWATRDGWPLGVIMSYLWRDGRFWLTAGAHRHRIAAIRRDPRVAIVVTSTGTELGPSKSITAKGTCQLREDKETKSWFYPALAAALHPDHPKAAADFEQRLDSPLRLILEVTPTQWITYDGTKMYLDSKGRLPANRKGKPKSADTERLATELRRRGL